MSIEIVTKDDLQMFRIQLLDDLKRMLVAGSKTEHSEWIKSKDVEETLSQLQSLSRA